VKQGLTGDSGVRGGLLSDFVININGQSSVKYLLSQLRDKNSNTFQFRFFSDRIMRLLIEEAISWEPKVVEKRLAPTGEYYDHYKLQYKAEDYCAVTIIRAGDSMIAEVMNLLPGITIGKVLIQRNEESEDKHPVMYYAKLPEDLLKKQRVFILDPMLATGGSVIMCI
jgi:uracil phosphoribosyltransferase